MNTIRTPRAYGEVIAVNVDIQNDFCPGGALGVNEGDQVVPIANEVNQFVRDNNGFVVFTRDWHPREDNVHFAENGGPWPVHCLQYPFGDVFPQSEEGAGLRMDLEIDRDDAIASKGMSGLDDGYSGTEAVIDNDSKLGDIVSDLVRDERTVGKAIERIACVNKELGKRTLVLVLGLATDYCDKATVLGALEATEREWVDVAIVEEGVRAVNIQPDDGDKAMQAMIDAGALAISIEDIRANNFMIDRRGER